MKIKYIFYLCVFMLNILKQSSLCVAFLVK